MVRIFQESEANDFDGIATGDESWLKYITPSSKIFADSAADVIPRTWQAVGAKTMITVFFTAKNYCVRCSSKMQHIQSVIFHQ
jgi:hypothetical protein